MATDTPPPASTAVLKRDPWTTIAQGSLAAGLTGASCGAILASYRGHSRAAWAFSMGTNWVVLTAPFLGIREVVLHYRLAKNAQEGINSYRTRNKDEMIASVAAGAFVGAGVGLVWRGPMAMIAGSLMYSALACGGQFSYLLARDWRLKRAVQERMNTINPPPAVEPDKCAFSLSRIWDMEILRENAGEVVEAAEIDPLGSLFIWARDKVNQNVNVPEWASPLMNAWDIEYRKRLNARLEILEAQVADLKEKAGES
ncbi:hypothetical protein DFS34DRAFT_129644 [Phlyctochytrium arcticum]|nr:hypothetical protein DFS34DRAFT_129644 [Phlyctochytrium arcticum]